MRELGIESDDDNPLIATYIAAAQAAIDLWCNRTFEAVADTTRYIDAIGQHIGGYDLMIPPEVGELASITEVLNGDGIEVTSSQYVTVPRNAAPFYGLRIKGSAGKTWVYDDDFEDAIAITGRWAYSVSPPAPIKTACIKLAAFYYRQKDVPFTDVTAVEAGVVVRPIGIPAVITPLLAPYRRL
jgi:hypothetical protein